MKNNQFKSKVPESQILKVIEYNDTNELREWFEHGELDLKLRIKNDFDRSLAMLAAYKANLKTLQFFVQKGADLNVKDRDDLTILEIVVAIGVNDQKEKIIYLLEHGLDFEHKGFLYCVLGELDLLKQWLIKNPNTKKTDRHGQTLLHYAAACNQKKIITYLIEKQKLTLVSRDKWGCTPLIRTAIHNHLATFTYLVEKNPKLLDDKSNNGYTILHWLAQRGHTKIIDWLFKYYKKEKILSLLHEKNKIFGDTPILLAVKNGKLKTIQLFVDMYPKFLNCKDLYGYNLMLQAAYYGHKNIIEWCLLPKNSIYFKLTDKNNNGDRVFDILISKGYLKILRWLLKKIKINTALITSIYNLVDEILKNDKLIGGEKLTDEKKYNYRCIKQLLEDKHKITFYLVACVYVALKKKTNTKVPRPIFQKIIKEVKVFEAEKKENETINNSMCLFM